LYQGHSVDDISRSDAGAYNLSKTFEEITKIIGSSKRTNCKSICFLTGVPGAGKTLAGLNLANQYRDRAGANHAVFLTGNGPLVEVLQEALSRDDVEQNRQNGVKISKDRSKTKSRAFVQNIHHFRDEGLKSEKPPSERVVVFDEAQRAWTLEQTASFMKRKKGIDSFKMSEAEFLISYMDRHQEWATIVCLIGGGQEINRGEAGIKEWVSAIKRSFPHWHCFVSSKLEDKEVLNTLEADQGLRVTYSDALHLSVSVRTFRSEKLSEFVKALLDLDTEKARSLYEELKYNYPIVLTRNISRAKDWIRSRARGTERFGLIASSGGIRLRPEGIHVKSEIDPKNWFLNDSTDVRSSYYMEEVATEFDVQGLELDWSLVAWDADLRITNSEWSYRSFKGTKWTEIKKSENKEYLKNAYRVLLTRARQGMVIFIPEGNDQDNTRLLEFYSGTFSYLRSLGIKEI
jgi:hypothetical protein